MIVVVMMMVMVPRYSQHTLDAAFDSTHRTTDRAANHRAGRTSCAVTYSCAMLGTAHNALGLCGERHRKKGKNSSSHDRSSFHE
jgi:hypothetical protein